MMADPEVAVVYSPRPWAEMLPLYVADHGGLRIRSRVLSDHDALEQSYAVLVVDEFTAFLSPRFIASLHDLGRRVLGVFHPQEDDVAHGKEALLQAGVDAVIEADAEAREIVELIETLARDSRAAGTQSAAPPPPPERAPEQRARAVVTVVAGPPGGVGSTELAIALAHAVLDRGEAVVLIDAADVAPAVARRLQLPLHPNLLVAVDMLERGGGPLRECLAATEPHGVEVLCGLPGEQNWNALRATQVRRVVDELAGDYDHVVVDVGSRVEDLSWLGEPARHGVTRAMIAAAHVVVGVLQATRGGVMRFIDWAAEVSALAPRTPLEVVVNKVPGRGQFLRGELEEEIRRACGPGRLGSVGFVPFDRRVGEAEWAGHAVGSGPFTKSVERLADAILPRVAPLAAPSRRFGVLPLGVRNES